MKTKILTILLGILLLAGIAGCFFLYNNNTKIKNDLAGIPQDIKNAEDTTATQKSELDGIEAAIAEAEKKQNDLSQKSQDAEASVAKVQSEDTLPNGNGYNLVEFNPVTAEISKDNAEVYLGSSDEYETVEELTKGTEITVDAKAVYQSASFYRIKDSGKFVNADAVEIKEQ